MRLIVDQQLPPVLADWFRARGIDASHVREIGLNCAMDTEIWAEATKSDAVVISRDDDFVTLCRLRGGARLVWVRIGNCTNAVLLAIVEANWPMISMQLKDGERLVELRVGS